MGQKEYRDRHCCSVDYAAELVENAQRPSARGECPDHAVTTAWQRPWRSSARGLLVPVGCAPATWRTFVPVELARGLPVENMEKLGRARGATVEGVGCAWRSLAVENATVENTRGRARGGAWPRVELVNA